jgi:replication factor A1
VSDASLSSATEPLEVRLRDLRPTERPVIIVGRVVSSERREITRRADGGKRPVLSGLLSDGTATVRFTWWDPPSEPLERGTVLRAGPVQVREYRGRPEVSFTWRTRVEPASDSDLPTLSPEELPMRSIGQLRDGDEGFRLEVRLFRLSSKTVPVGEERRLLFEGILADRTGSIGFTAWSDFRLKDGEALRIVGGYVRAFRGRPQLTLDERSHIERIDGSTLPTVAAWESAPARTISEVEVSRGGDLVRIEGTIIGLMPPSGVVYRCPTCRRTLSSGLCRLHGTVTGEPDLRARLVVDDGTGVATVSTERPATEALWDRTLPECLAQLREQPDPSRLEEQLFESVFGRRVRATGRAVLDDFGLTVYPDSVEPGGPPNVDPAEELRSRLARSAT